MQQTLLLTRDADSDCDSDYEPRCRGEPMTKKVIAERQTAIEMAKPPPQELCAWLARSADVLNSMIQALSSLTLGRSARHLLSMSTRALTISHGGRSTYQQFSNPPVISATEVKISQTVFRTHITLPDTRSSTAAFFKIASFVLLSRTAVS